VPKAATAARTNWFLVNANFIEIAPGCEFDNRERKQKEVLNIWGDQSSRRKEWPNHEWSDEGSAR
jgi:hypothetical protein